MELTGPAVGAAGPVKGRRERQLVDVVVAGHPALGALMVHSGIVGPAKSMVLRVLGHVTTEIGVG